MSEVSSEKGVMAFMQQMRNGELGLAKTFWLYGVLGSVVWQIMFISTLIFVVPAFIVGPLWIYYIVINLIGVWNAANTYQGPGVWPILAKIAVALNILMMAIMLIMIIGGAVFGGAALLSL